MPAHGAGRRLVGNVLLGAGVAGAATAVGVHIGPRGEPVVTAVAAVAAVVGAALALYALHRGRVGAPQTRPEPAPADAQRYRGAFEHADDAIFILDGWRFVECNPRATQIFGQSATRLIGLTPLDLSPARQPDGAFSAEKGRDYLEGALAGRAQRFEWQHLRGDGTAFEAEVSLVPLGEQAPGQLLGVVRDASERKRAELRMHMLSQALDETADGVLITAADGSIEYVNRGFEQITGYGRGEVLGSQPSLLKSGQHPKSFYRNLWRTLLAGEVFRDVLVNRRKDGSLYYEERTITPIRDHNGAIRRFVAVGKDLSERLAFQERLQEIAYYDVLTGKPNRALLTERIEHLLTRAERDRVRAALMVVDIDRFKLINDSFGYEAGDALLQAFAKRVSALVPDHATVARLSADELGVLLEHDEGAHEVVAIVGYLQQAMAAPFDLDGREIVVNACTGVSLFPEDATSAAALLRNADTAMHEAKRNGPGSYAFYARRQSERAYHRLTLQGELRRALERGELAVHLQPKVELDSSRICGAEVLVRWPHPQRGLLGPGEFVPLAEESGLISQLDEWVLRQACRLMARWRASDSAMVALAINVSGEQFANPELAARVGRALKDHGVEPGWLELEVTESTLIADGDNTRRQVEALHALGVRLAIDDFGTGYSSLSYLKRFPLHTVKVDRCFVADLCESRDDRAIVSAIAALAHHMQLQVVAEGVESGRQLEQLRELGCDVAQGFFFAHALKPEEFERWLHRRVVSTP